MKLIFRNTNRKGNGIVGLGSWLIRLIDRAVLPSGFVADHVAFFDEKSGDIIEVHRKEGVRYAKLSDWIGELPGGFKYEITDINKKISTNLLIKSNYVIQADYDHISLVWQWFKIKTGLWLGRVKNAYNAFICSEFVAYCLGNKKAYKMSVKDVIKEYVTPKAA